MKSSLFKSPSEATIMSTAALVGGGIVGGAVSRGAFGLIHDATTSTENAANMKRGAIVLAGGAVAVFVPGTSVVSQLVKGLASGMATVQALDIVKSLSEKNTTLTAAAASPSKAKQFLARTVGLGCACDQTHQLNARRRRRGMGMFVHNAQPVQEFARLGMPAMPSASLSESVSQGRAMVA